VSKRLVEVSVAEICTAFVAAHRIIFLEHDVVVVLRRSIECSITLSPAEFLGYINYIYAMCAMIKKTADD
jgi:hypothetical protein